MNRTTGGSGSDWTAEPGQESMTQKVKSAVSEATDKAQQKVEEVGRSVQDKVDESRGPAAQKLQSAASKLHEKVDSVAGVAHRAADKMEATAGYVREHDVKDMARDVENLVRRHPTQSLMAAAVIGFLLGRAFRNDD